MVVITISFGENPVRGGMPARDSISSVIIRGVR
jgi:hypothetical protein